MPLPMTPRGNLVYDPDGEVLREFFWDRSRVSIIQGPIGCLSADTEVMTGSGWIPISEWSGQAIAVWDGTDVYLDAPLAYQNLPCDEMWLFRSKHSLSMALSDEHRMPLYGRNGKLRIRQASDVAAAMGRNRVPTTFWRLGGEVSEARLRLHVAICADGCLPKRGNQVVIALRKERKKERLRQLLREAGIAWEEFQHSTRETELTFAFQRQDWMTKRLAHWSLSSYGLNIVLSELKHWDGLFEGDYERFDTTDKEAADFVQYAAHACGGRATIGVKTDPRNPDWSPLYSVHIAPAGSVKADAWLRSDHCTVERIKVDRKYCFTTSTGFFLARHDGCIFLTGNSGTSSACCHKMFRISQEQAPDRDGVRRTHWLVARESYPQLEKTTVKTWLEWFPEADYGEFRWSKPMTHTVLKPHPDGKTKVEMMLTFMALSDPEQAISDLASLEITGAFLNEMQFQEKAVLDEVLSRCSRYPSMKNGPGATWYGVIGDLNAPKEGHWIPYMRGDVPVPEDWDDEMRMEYEKPDDWRFFLQPAGLIEAVIDGKIVYQPNPKAENQRWLAEPYIQKVKGKPREWINERIMNRVGLYRAGKPVYPTFLEGEHVLEVDREPIPGFTLICGLDFGRDPAAVFAQCVNGQWHVLSEVIGSNESAELFAPKVKRHASVQFPGFEIEFYGDPRGADGGQNVEVTAYDIFGRHGMRVYPVGDGSGAGAEKRPEGQSLGLHGQDGPERRLPLPQDQGHRHVPRKAGQGPLLPPRRSPRERHPRRRRGPGRRAGPLCPQGPSVQGLQASPEPPPCSPLRSTSPSIRPTGGRSGGASGTFRRSDTPSTRRGSSSSPRRRGPCSSSRIGTTRWKTSWRRSSPSRGRSSRPPRSARTASRPS